MTGLSFRELFGHRLWTLAHAVEERTEAAIHAVCGLSMREARILATVAYAGEARLGYIREAAALERAYASRLIAGLVERGLLEKRADLHDQRTATWVLTDRGKTVHGAIHRESVERNRAWLNVLSPAEQASFNACIDVLMAHFQAASSEAEQPAVTVGTAVRARGNRRHDDGGTLSGSGAVADTGGGEHSRDRTRTRPRR